MLYPLISLNNKMTRFGAQPKPATGDSSAPEPLGMSKEESFFPPKGLEDADHASLLIPKKANLLTRILTLGLYQPKPALPSDEKLGALLDNLATQAKTATFLSRPIKPQYPDFMNRLFNNPYTQAGPDALVLNGKRYQFSKQIITHMGTPQTHIYMLSSEDGKSSLKLEYTSFGSKRVTYTNQNHNLNLIKEDSALARKAKRAFSAIYRTWNRAMKGYNLPGQAPAVSDSIELEQRIRKMKQLEL